MNAAHYEEMISLLNDMSARLSRMEQRLSEGAAPPPAPIPVGAREETDEGAIADARDLDGPYGNPEIRRDPPRWMGPSFAGRRFGDATPEYLESLAMFFDWKARESEKKDERVRGGGLKSKFIRLDAARARGWRKRLLEGSAAPGAAKPLRETMELDYEPDMPF